MNNNTFKPFKTIATYLLVVAAFFAVLGNLANSLTIYIGGVGLGTNHGATAAFTAAGFLLGTAVSTAVHFVILCIASVIAYVLITVLFKVSTMNTPENNATLGKFALVGLLVDVVVSLLLAILNASGLFIVLNTVSHKTELILLDAVISGVLSFCYFVPVLAFIGSVALTIFGIIAVVVFKFGGTSKIPR